MPCDHPWCPEYWQGILDFFFLSMRSELLRWALGTGIPHWRQKTPRRKLYRWVISALSLLNNNAFRRPLCWMLRLTLKYFLPQQKLCWGSLFVFMFKSATDMLQLFWVDFSTKYEFRMWLCHFSTWYALLPLNHDVFSILWLNWTNILSQIPLSFPLTRLFLKCPIPQGRHQEILSKRI